MKFNSYLAYFDLENNANYPMKLSKITMDLSHWQKKYHVNESLIHQLEPYHLKTIYGYENPVGDEYHLFHGSPEDTNVFNAELFSFFIVLLTDVHKQKLRWALSKLKREALLDQTIIVLIQGPKKKLYDLIPKEYIIIHARDSKSAVPTKMTYSRGKMHEKLKSLLDNIPNLPLQPKKVYGYGSFFRDKDLIGDIDLFVELDYNQPEWKHFDSFFRWREEDSDATIKRKNYYQLRKVIIDEYSKPLEEGRTRIMTFDKKLRDRAFQEKLQQFHIDLELLKYCTWSDLIGKNDYLSGYRFIPSLEEVFRKMFLKRVKGIHVSYFSQLEKDLNLVLLWTKENPSFETHYQAWWNDRITYIKKEFDHFKEELDSWIKEPRTNHWSYDNEQIQLEISKASEKLKRLKKEINEQELRIHSFEEYSIIINELRDGIKSISTELNNEIERILFNESLYRFP